MLENVRVNKERTKKKVPDFLSGISFLVAISCLVINITPVTY